MAPALLNLKANIQLAFKFYLLQAACRQAWQAASLHTGIGAHTSR